ncbi:kinase-like domain-containing protein, partial [Massariosphaeria phaeospora]
LSYLHGNTIRDRDLKPQNILVDGMNILYTDFRLSKDYSNEIGSTSSGVTARSSRYCAPAVANYDARNSSSDIWSLRVIYLEVCVILKGRNLSYMSDIFSQHGDR